MWLSTHPMHLPDGFLSILVAAIFWIVSFFIVAVAIRRVSQERDERKLPIMGILAAAIFSGQMLNFAIAGGTSGHLLGATLAMIIIGPWPAILVMTCVVAVQALVFQDGGLLALGANIFNMAIIGVLVSYTIYSFFLKLSKGNRWGYIAGATVGAWCSIEIASLAVGMQLALSGTSPSNISIPAMAGIHALIGIGEALITLGAILFLMSTRPDLLSSSIQTLQGRSKLWITGLMLAIGLAILSPLASTHPDGLEWVAEQQGFINLVKPAALQLIPNYLIPGINNAALATILAGLAGITIIIGVFLILTHLRHKNQK